MILVTGGTGIVGGRVVQALLDSQVPVRLFARGFSDWRGNLMPHFRRLGVDVMSGDVRDQDKVAAAVSGCTAIINLAGIMRETPGCDVESINVEGTRLLLELGKSGGVQRFIQVSCLGATQFSTSRYFASKWQAEALVRESSLYWTIFRPSLIFAPGSQLSRTLEFWVDKVPFIPVVGSGLNAIAPVSAEDVVACVVQSLYNRATVDQTYELAGPQVFSFTELLEIAAGASGRGRRPVIKFPTGLGLVLARLIDNLNQRAPITEDIIRTLTTELVADSQEMQRNFQVPLIPFESGYKALAGKNTRS